MRTVPLTFRIEIDFDRWNSKTCVTCTVIQRAEFIKVDAVNSLKIYSD